MSNVPDPRADFYKSMNEARLLDARTAVQAGLYINGLAATAVLTFLGSVAPKIEATTSAHARLPKAFIWSLGLFAFGVFCSALAAVYSYLANHNYAEANAPFGSQDDEYHKKAQENGSSAHRTALVAGLGALTAFLAGVVAAIVGFDRLI